jgi:hypothetical protein
VNGDQWAERGFCAVAEKYLARLTQPCLGIIANRDLIRADTGQAGNEQSPSMPALKATLWLDRKTGMPLL